MICCTEVLVATGGPLVPPVVVHDAEDVGAGLALAVVTVLGGAAEEIVLHAQVVAELVSHILIRRASEHNYNFTNVMLKTIFCSFLNIKKSI